MSKIMEQEREIYEKFAHEVKNPLIAMEISLDSANK